MNPSPPLARPHQPLLGIGCVTLGMLGLAAQEGLFKWLMESYALTQVLAIRSLLMLVLIVAVVALRGELSRLRPRHPGFVLARACIMLVAFAGYFNGLKQLPLADAVALGFGAPLFVALLSAPLLGERVGARGMTAVVAGFCGVVLMARPTGDASVVPALLVIGGSAMYALAMVMARRVAATESSVCMVFWTAALFALAGLPLSLPVWTAPPPADWLALLALAVTAALAHLLMTHSYRVAPVAVVAPFEYTALVWAVLFGYLVWGDLPQLRVLAGAAVVIGAGLYVLRAEMAAARRR